MKVRPATRGDLVPWFSGTVPKTMRAFVLEHDGQVIAVGGVAEQKLFRIAFSRVAEGARDLPGAQIGLGRLAVRVRSLIHASGEVWADQDMSEPTSAGLLAWCGFVEQSSGSWLRAR